MDEAMKTALTTAFTSVQSDILGMITACLPIGLGIFAAFFGIKKTVGFFRSIAKG